METSTVHYIIIVLFEIILCSLVTEPHSKGFNSKEFSEIIGKSMFVDKTMYIKPLLEEKGFLLITAPPRSGKTTILSSLKTFLEFEVSETGEPITSVNHWVDIINDTQNFQLFSSHNLTAFKCESVLINYFGKTPTILLDIKPTDRENISLLYDVVRLCKNCIHKSFKEHEYLVHSERLTEDQRQYVKIWVDDHSYKTMVEFLYVSHGLQSLAQYLHQHFLGRPVFVLIDNYDSIIQQASDFINNESELNEIKRYVFRIISDVTKDSKEYVGGALVTGVSDVTQSYESYFRNFTVYNFQREHKYSEMFRLPEAVFLKQNDY